jgi:PE family
MAYVVAVPEMMAALAADLAGVGSDLSTAHAAAAVPTVGLVPAAADEVSASIANLFSRYAEDYHALAGRASAFQDQFVQRLHAGACAYASTEAANATWLQVIEYIEGAGRVLQNIEAHVVPTIVSLLHRLPQILAEQVSLFEKYPIQYLIGLFVILPVLLILSPLLLFFVILAAA